MAPGWGAVREEAASQVGAALPLFAFNVSQFALNLAAQAWVGHLGELELAAASLALSFSNVTGLSIVIGLSFALETLVSQANGAKRYAECGVHLQRSFFVISFVLILITIGWSPGPAIFRVFGQTAEVSELAGRFLLAVMPSVWFQGVSCCIQRFLQAQGIFGPLLPIAAVLFGLQLALLAWLVEAHGFLGAAYASNATAAAGVVLLTGYAWWLERERAPEEKRWSGWSREAVNSKGVYEFLALALPSLAMITIEWWSFEMVILLSGALPGASGGVTTSASAVFYSAIAASFTVTLGLASSASSRTGNALGAGEADTARFRSVVSALLALAYAGFVGTFFMVMARYWALLFANATETEVLELFESLRPVLFSILIGDTLQGVVSGVVRGCGKQQIGGCINFVAFYVIGTPLSVILAFSCKQGVLGLWVGLAVASNLQTSMLALCVYRTDWTLEALRASASPEGGERVDSSLDAEVARLLGPPPADGPAPADSDFV